MQVNNGLAEPVASDPAKAPCAKLGPLSSQIIMNAEPLLRTVTIHDPQGLHMRPASVFAKCASQFRSQVLLRRDDRTANGKSLLELITLAAEPGTTLVLEVAGDDAATALNALADLIESVAANGSDKESDPPPKG